MRIASKCEQDHQLKLLIFLNMEKPTYAADLHVCSIIASLSKGML